MERALMPTDQDTRSILDEIVTEMAQSSSAARGEGAVRPEMLLAKDFGFDSLDFVDLITTVEERFDIEVDDGVFGAIETVGDLHRYVAALMAARADGHAA
jgi:acyl carrier protein